MNVLHLHENMGPILQLTPEIWFDVDGMVPGGSSAQSQPSSDHPLQPL